MTRRRFIGHANCAAISAVPVLNMLLSVRLAGPHICQRRFVCVTFTDDCAACQAEGIGNVSVGMFFDDDFESGHGADVTLEPRPGKQSPQISTCAEWLPP